MYMTFLHGDEIRAGLIIQDEFGERAVIVTDNAEGAYYTPYTPEGEKPKPPEYIGKRHSLWLRYEDGYRHVILPAGEVEKTRWKKATDPVSEGLLQSYRKDMTQFRTPKERTEYTVHGIKIWTMRCIRRLDGANRILFQVSPRTLEPIGTVSIGEWIIPAGEKLGKPGHGTREMSYNARLYKDWQKGVRV